MGSDLPALSAGTSANASKDRLPSLIPGSSSRDRAPSAGGDLELAVLPGGAALLSWIQRQARVQHMQNMQPPRVAASRHHPA